MQTYENKILIELNSYITYIAASQTNKSFYITQPGSIVISPLLTENEFAGETAMIIKKRPYKVSNFAIRKKQ